MITTWHHRRIGPGDELHRQIDEQFNAADIVLLLVSADFLASFRRIGANRFAARDPEKLVLW